MQFFSEEAQQAELPEESIYQHMTGINRDHRDDIAIRYFKNTITYGKLLDDIDQAAAAFQSLGVKKGDIVTFCTVTIPEFVVALYALNKLGAAPLVLDPRDSCIHIMKSATPRKETDEPLILSGLYHNKTTGSPVTAIFKNSDTHSSDYHPEVLCPSHADYTAAVKFHGNMDLRGSGPFSGRLTACMVFAGALCRQVLERRGVSIAANAVRVGKATGKELNFDMTREILDARAAGDSVGSVLECVVNGVPAGVGGLMFGGMESRIASILYAIPGVKGVEFGLGFGLAEKRGSEANDPFRLEKGRVVATSNNAGGINGGITNGMPLVVRMAMRPTASIAAEQQTVNIQTMEETTLRVHGRHDPCLAPRAIPVMEAALAIAVLDAMMETAALDNV